MLRAIIFDLDGVLIDSEDLMRFAFTESYRKVIDAGEPPIEAYLEHMGESFPHIMDHLGLPHTLWKPFRELCQLHIDRINLFPESLQMLSWAQEMQIKLAVLTGKDQKRTLQILDHFSIRHFFQTVMSSDQLQSPKPHPEGVLTILRDLDCDAREAVVVGDAVSDIVCAQRAGVKAIAVTWGIKPERVQALCSPDYIVHSWEELLQVFCEVSLKSSEPRTTQQARMTQ